MQSDWYTLLSMGMRYWFSALAAVIVLRAWQATVRDTRRARVLRAWAPDTGAIGEIIVMSGGSGVRKGTRIPIPKEGLLGSSRRSDVRLKHPDVKRYHAHIEQRENGVLVETMARAEIWLGGRTGQKLLLRDGDRFEIGSLKLMLVLYTPGSQPETDDTADDELFSPVGIAAIKGSAGRETPVARKKASVVDFMDGDITPSPQKKAKAGSAKPSAKKKRSKPKKVPAADELFMPFDDGLDAYTPKKRAAKGAKKTADSKDEEVYWWQDGNR